MTERELLEAMNHIDEDLVQEAAEYTDSRKTHGEIPEAGKASGVQANNEAASSGGKSPGTRAEGSVPDYTDGPTAVTVLTKKPAKKGRFFRIPSSAAAAIALVILAGTAWGGVTIRDQQKRIRALEEEMTGFRTEAAGEAGESGLSVVGIPDSAIGAAYTLRSSYKEVYRALKDMGAQLQEQNKNSGGFLNAIMPATGGVESAAAAADGAVLEEVAEAPAAPMEEPVEEVGAVTGAAGHSTTNVMTEGVDESDIIKTDGKFIYMVQSGSVKITDIRQGKPGESARLTVPFRSPSDSIREMYVDGGTLVVITSHAEKATGSERFDWIRRYEDYVDQTYAYVFDITNPMKPELSGEMYQDGSYKTSRKVDDVVYLFTQRQVRLPAGSEEDALKEENLNQWVPSVNGVPLDAGCIWFPDYGYYSLVVSSFNTSDPGTVVDAKAILNDYCDIYVGSGHIYLYRNIWSDRQLTEITSIAYANGRILAGSDTTVSGCINDSFAINEKSGILRVLTTDYTGGTVNTLYVLDPQMKLMGRIDEIARNEDIYAARFLGDMAYFITYENHDPLFVADLSDPYDPKLLGQVEISGFSDYLHIWDDTHLLGIGYETNEASNRLGMKLVMFDVSDPANPVIENTRVVALHKERKEDDWNIGYHSETVGGNYKGILADPGQNLIGFGFNFYEHDKNVREAWYDVFSYDRDNGFERKLAMELPTTDSVSSFRGLYSGSWFYLAGQGEIDAFDMAKDFSPAQ